MDEVENINEPQNTQLNIGVVGNRKYWYRTDVHACVLCGIEKIYRQRVFEKDKAGTHWHDDACNEHF